MRKLAVAVLAVALAGTASAGGWRSLEIDGSSEEGFEQSIDAFRASLPVVRQYVFILALQDIWVAGSAAAEAEQHEYTADDYFAQLDGLGYKDVVRLSDPSGDKARLRFRTAHATLFPRNAGGNAPSKMPWPDRPAQIGFSGEQVRGIDDQAAAMQQRLSEVGRLW